MNRSFFPYIFGGDSIFALWASLPFIHITNVSVSGSRIEHQIGFIEKGYPISHNGLILHVGTNNIGQGDSVASTIATFSTFLDYANTVFTKVYVMAVPPINPTKYLATWGNIKHYLNNSNAKVADINSQLQSLCTAKGVTFIDICTPISVGGIMNPDYTDDGIHPNAAGYVVYAATLRAAIANLV